MNAVVASGSGRFNAVAVHCPRVAIGLVLGLAACAAWSLEGATSPLADAAAVATPGEPQRLQMEISASTLPRFENTDGSSRTSRVDVTWLPPRRSALGLSLGMNSMDGPAAFYPSGGYAGMPGSLDLGLRWRYTLDGNYRIDVTAWRRLVPPDALTLVQMHQHQPGYGARVEMQIRPVPKSGFVADRGFIGLQLESGARVTVRRSGGKPMIYYRTKF